MPNILKLETGEELIIDKDDDKMIRILAAKIRLKSIIKFKRRYTWYYTLYFPHRNNPKDISNIRQMFSFRNINEKMLKELEMLPTLIKQTQKSGQTA
jgi:hypothetical protein